MTQIPSASSTAPRLRVVFTTADSTRGQRILLALHRRGVAPDAVLLLTGVASSQREPLLRRALRWPRSVAGGARRRLRMLRRRRSYRRYVPIVIVTGAMNSRRMLRDLRALRPDLLVLGGGGIVSDEVIAAAAMGALNAHPGLLPWARGNGIVGHSLEHGVAVGVSVHYVERRIDAGPIVLRRLLPVAPGPSTLAALEDAADELAAEAMADVIERAVRTGSPPTGEVQRQRFPLLRWPDPAGRERHAALAREGRAGELFARWSARCLDGEGWVLPDGDEGPPVPSADPP